MDILRRFITQTLRENRDELHRSEMQLDQMRFIALTIYLA
jgi:hypothetical protein